MRIYLVAHSVMTDGYLDFLSAHKTWWRRDTGDPAAQRLVEFAGRVCYMSFGERQSPRDNHRYIENLVDELVEGKPVVELPEDTGE